MASFSERYHEYTKYHPETIGKLGPVDFSQQPPLFKEWQNTESINLLPHLPFLVDHNCSTNWTAPLSGSSELVLSLGCISSLLYLTCGITSLVDHGGEFSYFRANPSAGGLYPVEVYIAIRNSPELLDGIYAFHPLKTALIPLRTDDVWSEIESAYMDTDAIKACELLVLFSARMQRGTWRYKDRAYRRILLDTSHALANTQIFCEYHHLHSLLLPGFHDEAIAFALGLDPDTEPVLASIGLARTALPDTPLLRSPFPGDAVLRTQHHQSIATRQNVVERVCSWFPIKDRLPEPFETEITPEITDHICEEQLLQALRIRRSCRQFEAVDMDASSLFAVLRFALQSSTQFRIPQAHLNHWLVVRNVDGLAQGIYKLEPTSVSLKKTSDFYDWEPFSLACLSQDITKNCSALLVQTANLDQATSWLGDRSYRYLTFECGRIGERLNVAGMLMDVGSSGVGGYFDDLINELLGIESTEAILYMSCLGVPSEE